MTAYKNFVGSDGHHKNGLVAEETGARSVHN